MNLLLKHYVKQWDWLGEITIMQDQTWKTVQIVSVLAAGLLSIDFKFENLVATFLGAIPVVLSAGIGAAITWSHRKLERRKFIHIMNCEELLGRHRDDIIPLDIGKEKMADKIDVVRDCLELG